MVLYLADDHKLVATGIASVLREIQGVEQVHIFPNGKELLQAVKEKIPDFVFLDVEMPVMDGKKTLENLLKLYPGIPCCMLSMVDEKSIIEEFIQMGAKGFLHKDSNLDELSNAISNIKKGENFFSNEILKSLSGVLKKRHSVDLVEPLSERELEILKYICDGFSPKEIADKLFLSHRTVDTHKNNIMQKFEVNTVSKLISVALKNKVV